jgi:hypothetical protein
VSDVDHFLDNALLWRSRELRDVLSKLCCHPDSHPTSRPLRSQFDRPMEGEIGRSVAFGR